MTPMQKAILLVLQEPSCVEPGGISLDGVDTAMPGATILSKLTTHCRAEGSTPTTTALLEYCKALPEYVYLKQLATRIYQPNGQPLSLEAASTELAQIIPTLFRQT